MSQNTCRRCGRTVVGCRTCRGAGKVWGTFGRCTDCGGTGYRCTSHGKNWS